MRVNRLAAAAFCTASAWAQSQAGGDAKRLETRLGRDDRREIDEYLYAVRDIETRIQKAEKQNAAVDGSLFDHSLITYGSGLSPGHNHDNVPTLLTGGNHGRFRLGRQIKYKAETPLANLHVMMPDAMGVPTEQFADSNGTPGVFGRINQERDK